MKQSDIGSVIYRGISSAAEKFSCNGVRVRVVLRSIGQAGRDTGSRQIIVDEKLYDPPVMFNACAGVIVEGEDFCEAIKVYCELALYFKENPGVNVEGFQWHGFDSREIFLQPVYGHGSALSGDGVLELDYGFTFGVNCSRGTEMKRVEKRSIYGVVKK